MAVEIISRGIKGQEPLIPPEYEGLQLPVRDLLLALDYAVELFAAKVSREHGAGLRKTAARMRRGILSVCAGRTLIQL